MKCKTLLVFFASVMAMGYVAGCRKQSQAIPPVAATNSLLECAVKDLLGDSTAVLRLAEPGMCPGHFDIRPSQVEQLRSCRILLRLDFQKSLDTKLTGAKDDGLYIAEIRVSGGLCEPESYLEACRQTADALVAAGLLERDAADTRLTAITDRIEQTAARCRHEVAALKDTPVIVSVHQEAFCKWLGLQPVALFTGADEAGVGQVDEALRQGEQASAKLVIANLPEGRRVADALAARLGAKVVVFGNFPALNDGQSSFDDLLEANVRALMKAVDR
ncbi:MAG: metal ABC transporter solute-binding protein, Zn/Mn family [Phycisphaerae bacterium]